MDEGGREREGDGLEVAYAAALRRTSDAVTQRVIRTKTTDDLRQGRKEGQRSNDESAPPSSTMRARCRARAGTRRPSQA